MNSEADTNLPETEVALTAIRFINSTASHIFLTGKAGTGKTTFLKNLADRTHKRIAVVAPTGIAALNAGGVTIHSQFLLPFGMHHPDRNAVAEDGSWYSQTTLAKKHPLNSQRKQVLRSIDLLVIDEVSMLRADILDAIDYRLKAARGNFKRGFGGVQLLLIGDLYQLPPVVKREEATRLNEYYKSPWFFESHALQKEGFVYIELDKIFRQRDDVFIGLLNNLRNNVITSQDIDMLNRHRRSEEEIKSLNGVITLTTHNYKADELNQKALRALESPSVFFTANVEGDFPESMFPVADRIELKEGAQIMFIRNDRDGAYYNGMIASVISILDDKVEVKMIDSGKIYPLKREIWENKKYLIDQETKVMTDEVAGTFQQYPVRLAWAITVHKSQGLTFDKAVIDVGEAFADGQVYVALSRLRSLDGLILRTKINPGVVSTDKHVVVFSESNNKPAELPVLMKARQLDFVRQIIDKTFDFEILLKETAYLMKSPSNPSLEEKSMTPVLQQLNERMNAETSNSFKFRDQLYGLMNPKQITDLLLRLKKGSAYYEKFFWDIMNILLKHTESVRQMKRVKGYLSDLADLDVLLTSKIYDIDTSPELIAGILEGRHQFDFKELNAKRLAMRTNMLETLRKELGTEQHSSGKKKSKKKKDGPSTYEVTLQLLSGGMNSEAIATERGLTLGTIEGHLAKAVETKGASIFSFMSEETVNTILDVLRAMPEGFTSKDLYIKFDGKYGYGKLKAVINHEKVMMAEEIERIKQ